MRILYYCDWFKEYASCIILALPKDQEVAVVLRGDTLEFQGRRSDEILLHSRVSDRSERFIELPGRYWSISSARILMQEFVGRRFHQKHDVLHLQATPDPRFLWLAWRMPTVLTVHEPAPRYGLHLQRGARGAVKNGLSFLYRRFADIIIVHTHAGLLTLSPRERRKALVIPHGVNPGPSETQPASRESPTPEQPDTILFFGRVEQYKGIEVLLASMEVVWKTRPDARLRILANPGAGLHGLDALVLDSRIKATWHGYSQSELTRALQSTRVICMPYLSVSGSGVAAQALGSGKPIAGSDLQGLREFVTHTDLLAEPGNAKDLARALLAALNNNYQPRQPDPHRTWPAIAEAHLSAYVSATCFRR